MSKLRRPLTDLLDEAEQDYNRQMHHIIGLVGKSDSEILDSCASSEVRTKIVECKLMAQQYRDEIATLRGKLKNTETELDQALRHLRGTP